MRPIAATIYSSGALGGSNLVVTLADVTEFQSASVSFLNSYAKEAGLTVIHSTPQTRFSALNFPEKKFNSRLAPEISLHLPSNHFVVACFVLRATSFIPNLALDRSNLEG